MNLTLGLEKSGKPNVTCQCAEPKWAKKTRGEDNRQNAGNRIPLQNL